MHLRRILCVGTLALAMAAPVSSAAQADPVQDFYSGKTVQLRIGYGPGGRYDLSARLVARYLGKYIPGNPKVVPQNMPGAASLVLTKYLYETAPKDGTVIGIVSRGIAFEPLLKAPRSDYDPMAFNWLANFERGTSFCAVWHTAGINSLDDVITGGKTLIVGGTGPASDDELFARVVREMFKANVKIVTGYAGSNAVHLAMERGEVNARCNLAAADILQRPEWKNGKVKLLMQNGSRPHPQFKDVPLSVDLAKDDAQREVLRFFFARLDVAYPFVAPPGVPADRVKALKDAFVKVMNDPEFVKEAQKLSFDVTPTTGDEIVEIVKKAYASSPATIEKAIKLRNQ